MRGSGYGILVDIVLGLVGGVVGRLLFDALGVFPGGGVFGSILVSFAGAVIVVALARAIKR